MCPLVSRRRPRYPHISASAFSAFGCSGGRGIVAATKNPPPTGESQQLIEEARGQGGEAPVRLLEHFRAYLLLVANRKLPEDVCPKVGASDLVQETLLRAHDHFGRFRGGTEDELRGWLRRILLNHLADVINHYRGTGKRALAREVPLAQASPDELAGAPARGGERPSTVARAQERNAALQRALEQLAENYRRVIAWRSYDRLSFGEVGQRLGCSAEAARKLWTRAVDRLGRILEPPDEGRG